MNALLAEATRSCDRWTDALRLRGASSLHLVIVSDSWAQPLLGIGATLLWLRQGRLLYLVPGLGPLVLLVCGHQAPQQKNSAKA